MPESALEKPRAASPASAALLCCRSSPTACGQVTCVYIFLELRDHFKLIRFGCSSRAPSTQTRIKTYATQGHRWRNCVRANRSPDLSKGGRLSHIITSLPFWRPSPPGNSYSHGSVHWGDVSTPTSTSFEQGNWRSTRGADPRIHTT